jgi:NAD(P)-dependent dehydrogenase (short-subunit alcohol dehydrogenase family)
MGWPGKVVIVGGVGSGLGSAVAALLAASGAQVVGVARRADALEAVRAEAAARGWKFDRQTADLSVAADARAVVRSALERFGRIDGASLNMGRWTPGDTLLHKLSDEEWSTGIHDNLDAVFQLSRAVLPHFIEQGRGALVVVSATERVRRHGTAAYCTAKGGLIDLVRKMAADYRPMGIRVNAVLPGNMEHDVDVSQIPSESAPLPLRDQSGVGAWEVARAIRFLLSEEARWITAAPVIVDGGFSTRGKEPSVPP